MKLECIIDEIKLKNNLFSDENFDNGTYSNIYEFNSEIIIKEYIKIDNYCPYLSLNNNLLWEFEVNKYLFNSGFNVPNVIDYFQADNILQNPILIMEKLKAEPLQKMIDEKLNNGISCYDLFMFEKFDIFTNLFTSSINKIYEYGFDIDDCEIRHNTMYSENPDEVVFYDFLGWYPNKNILKFIDKDFKEDFPLIYQQVCFSEF